MASTRQITEPLGTEPLGIAVISPDDYRRSLAIRALDGFPQGRIREFISYPPDVDSVTRVLKESFDVVIIDLDSDPEYTLNLVEKICADGATNVIVYSQRSRPRHYAALPARGRPGVSPNAYHPGRHGRRPGPRLGAASRNSTPSRN